MIRLANDDFKVYGVDISEDSIELIRRKVKSQDLSHHIKIQKDDVSALSFQDNTFDGIVCEEVLEHLENDERPVKEFYRVLNPGGVCVVTVPSSNIPLDDIDRYYGHLRKYSRDEFERLFQKNNFNIVKTEYYGFPVAQLWRQCIAIRYMRFQIKKSRGKMMTVEKNTFLTYLSPFISKVFSIDNLFNRLQFGTGLIGMFSKPPQVKI
jgi:ubiquinone/menaquinone biosynthesis C-methylase UbiE